eukprot:TRINITY_DN8073_c0_g5_i1.p2 TRINITY_DN8073_c0_g5~~TRINITY_DN8073_c0_g5_i1.p2  ORF type:complete len:141 (-),score=14.70 TRINITY_DN8073_c0_g5_i1:286-708(-)
MLKTDFKEEHPNKKFLSMRVTFSKTHKSIVSRDSHLPRNANPTLSILLKTEISMEDNEMQMYINLSLMLLTFFKPAVLEIVFKEEHSHKKSLLMQTTPSNAPKSMVSSDLHACRNDPPTFRTLAKTEISTEVRELQECMK